MGARVLLVNPPPVHGHVFTRQGRCQEREDVLGTTKPPLTLAWLAARLRAAGSAVRLADLTAMRVGSDAFADQLAADGFSPTLIIFPSSFPTWDADVAAMAALKRRFQAPLIGFGPHASAAPMESMTRAPDVDGVLVGEPEDAAVVLASLRAGDDWSQAESLMFRRGDTIVRHRAPGRFAGFDSAVMPDWTGVDFRHYRLPLVDAPYVLVETSRGCPYTCDFCVAPLQQGHKFRERPAARVVDEIEAHVRDRGLRHFYFWGDTVTLHQQSLLALADELRRRRLRIRWLANARADNLGDPSTVARLKASGCWMLSFGVESASTTRRDSMHKRLGESPIRAAAAHLRASGIRSFAFFILGYPGETREMMDATIDYAAALGVDFAGFYPAVPYPGTELGDRAAASGWLTQPLDWSRLEYSYYAMQVGELNEATVMAAIRRARRRFFLRPSYLASRAGDLARVALTKPSLSARMAWQMVGRFGAAAQSGRTR